MACNQNKPFYFVMDGWILGSRKYFLFTLIAYVILVYMLASSSSKRKCVNNSIYSMDTCKIG